MSSSPAKARPYLAEPDYYRLGYQLAAQLLNREHAQENKGEAHEGWLSGWLRDLTDGERAERPGSREAFDTAAEVLSSARAMSCWYGARDDAPWWRFWVKLSRKEARLMGFLLSTVEPCLELVIAASVPEAQWTDLVSIERLRDKAKAGQLSYRAVYNLACHEAGDKGEAALALAYLRLAFRLAPADRRRGLVKWAAKDPSLSPVREEPEFTVLLKTFGVS